MKEEVKRSMANMRIRIPFNDEESQNVGNVSEDHLKTKKNVGDRPLLRDYNRALHDLLPEKLNQRRNSFDHPPLQGQNRQRKRSKKHRKRERRRKRSRTNLLNIMFIIMIHNVIIFSML